MTGTSSEYTQEFIIGQPVRHAKRGMGVYWGFQDDRHIVWFDTEARPIALKGRDTNFRLLIGVPIRYSVEKRERLRQGLEKYERGTLVEHPDFGFGYVLNHARDHIVINFASHGKKRLHWLAHRDKIHLRTEPATDWGATDSKQPETSGRTKSNPISKRKKRPRSPVKEARSRKGFEAPPVFETCTDCGAIVLESDFKTHEDTCPRARSPKGIERLANLAKIGYRYGYCSRCGVRMLEADLKAHEASCRRVRSPQSQKQFEKSHRQGGLANPR